MLHRATTAIYSTKDAAIGNRDPEVETPIVALNDSGKRDKKSSIELNAVELCLCGAFATAFGDFCVHPIDTIKVTQQAAATTLSFIAAMKRIFLTKGPLGFYQGIVPYVLGDGSSGAIKFATFELSKQFLERRLPSKYHPLIQFFCAATAMLACSIVLVPGEVVKTRMQAGAVGSMASVVSQILKADGLPGLFIGYYATLIRDVPYTMLELGVYENVKSLLRRVRKVEVLGRNDELAAAAFTGCVAAFLTTPLDLVKTKLMVQTASSSVQYSGVFDALSSLYVSGGLGALFVGSTARITWLVPFTTIYLGVYEASKRKLLELKKAST